MTAVSEVPVFVPKLRVRILVAIQDSGKTQKQIAAEIGVSTSVVSRWVRGQRDPGVYDLIKLADATNAPWLLDLRSLPSLRVAMDLRDDPPTAA